MKTLPGAFATPLFLLLLLAASAPAQVSPDTGAIRGTVTDPSGAVLPDATVTLLNRSLSLERTTRTEADGVYVFPLVPPAGGYRVEIEAPGFQRGVIENLTVRITEIASGNLKLAIGAVEETVAVTSAPEQVQTASSGLGGTLPSPVITALPLNTRNTLELLGTDAGVVAQPGTATSLFVLGGRSTYNNYVLNGMDANNFEQGSLTSVQLVPNPDSVQEFRTQTGMYDATLGRNSGATVTLLTRSGTDRIHGVAYDFLRPSVVAANSFFLNRAGIPRPFLNRDTFGGALGGPLPGRKTFWFASYEGSRQRNLSSVNSQLPVLPAQRDAPSLAAAFGLPARAIDPVAVRILNLPGPYGGSYWPSGFGAPVGRLGSFTFATTSILNEDQGSAKLDRDWKLRGQANRVSAFLFFSRSDSFNPIGGSSGQGFRAYDLAGFVNDDYRLTRRLAWSQMPPGSTEVLACSRDSSFRKP